MLRASSYGKSSETLFQIVGSNEYFSVKLPSKDFDKLQLRLQGQSFIPETKYNREGLLLKANESIKTDGIYALSNSKSKSLLAQIAFNYNRNESEIENLNADALSNLGFKNVLNANMENFESTLKQESKGTPYWKYCIILVLLFLGIEVLIIKLIKP